MGWNEPDKGKDKDSWRGKNQPPDLDEALKRLQSKLKKSLFGGGSKGKKDSNGSSGGGALAVVIGLIIVLLWALSGIFIVDPAERAAILRFGKYVKTVGPGPHWIPRIIASKRVVNVDRVSDHAYSAQMLTKDENLVSVALVVQYRIGDLERYLFSVSDPIESLQQATSSALRQVIGATTFDQIITEGREQWATQVQETLIEILESYKTGIVVVNVSPQPARAPDNVQDAFDDAIRAQEDEKRYKEQARAYEARVVPISEGNAIRILAEAKAFAEQVVLRAHGDTAEFLELLPEYLRSPYVTGERLYLETMQQVLSRSSKVITDGQSGNLLYLPLDQLMNRLPADKSLRHQPEKNEEDTDQDSANTLLDGRELLRPTIRPGRTQS